MDVEELRLDVTLILLEEAGRAAEHAARGDAALAERLYADMARKITERMNAATAQELEAARAALEAD